MSGLPPGRESNAIQRPSGDHRGLPVAGPPNDVSRLTLRPSLSHTQISIAPVRFDAKTIDDAIAAAGVADAVESDAIVLRAPDIAENSALVHLEIQSGLPDTQSILLFAEKNPQPLVAQFDVLPGLEPFRGRRVLLLGGGDSAVDWALHLESIAAELTLIHRRDQFRAHEDSVRKLQASRCKVVRS